MKNLIIFTLTMAAALSSAAAAQTLSIETINATPIVEIPADRPAQPPELPDPAMIRLQVLLDRAGASPGVIDGKYGANVSKAIAAFEAMSGLPIDGKLDDGVFGQLEDGSPVVGNYQISSKDTQGLVDAIPQDYADQASMEHLGFTSVAERLSERFHMDPRLLKTLNPTSRFVAGETIVVTAPNKPKTGIVTRIEAHRRTGQVVAYAEDGKILTIYPATIGSDDNPTPSGSHKVEGVARMPDYTYNPKINFQQGGNKKVLKLPSGPNNPVGTVWIDLSEPTYGIHGTPEPTLIDKAGSHGCIRLTNWDVEELAGMVKPGVMVDIVE
ncbi:L,D-transpeptidase [Neorhizobium sp. JUb45]|uniref:L,D-transpeptidase family protein n=1 Tax=Neorhizobium sp. JUb45 TaxID=2485113 RepID=UPI00104F8B38|nr:L,D-transpeptidase [Neorhizobium sp. JUb45]TCR00416.1 lipoprotein-anchoring transpeptidase ErfK/SrfK [Neorhizobium sp. JUb45]